MEIKNLDNIRKFKFVIYVILGSGLVILGILNKNFISVCFGIFAIMTALTIQIDQEYKQDCIKLLKSQKEAYLIISKAIKNKDMNILNRIAKIIDENYKEGKYDKSNR